MQHEVDGNAATWVITALKRLGKVLKLDKIDELLSAKNSENAYEI